MKKPQTLSSKMAEGGLIQLPTAADIKRDCRGDALSPEASDENSKHLSLRIHSLHVWAFDEDVRIAPTSNLRDCLSAPAIFVANGCLSSACGRFRDEQAQVTQIVAGLAGDYGVA
jgi:hypothetical protein